jgi:hypothetical protein
MSWRTDLPPDSGSKNIACFFQIPCMAYIFILRMDAVSSYGTSMDLYRLHGNILWHVNPLLGSGPQTTEERCFLCGSYRDVISRTVGGLNYLWDSH